MKPVIQKVVHALLYAFLFLMSVLPMLLPYRMELFFLLSLPASAGICIFAVRTGNDLPSAVRAVTATLASVSFLLSVLFLITRAYVFYYFAEAVNLALLIFRPAFAALSSGGSRQRSLLRTAAALLCVLAAFVAGFSIYSHLRYHRTVMATIAEIVQRSSKIRDESVPAIFDEKVAAGETDFVLPQERFEKEIVEDYFGGMKVYTVNQSPKSSAVVLYIHGGYYVNQAIDYEITFAGRVVDKTDSTLVFPVYPLAPFHTVEDSFENMLSLYEKIREDAPGKKVVLMGDSAGAGYCAALAIAMGERGISQPDELILISPWVDVTMRNPSIQDYDSADPRSSIQMGITSGEAWRGNYAADDWHVSPVYGDLSALRNVTVFTGTREIFYPDAMIFAEKLIADGAENVECLTGEGQNHVYAVFPTLEGRSATEKICGIILR